MGFPPEVLSFSRELYDPNNLLFAERLSSIRMVVVVFVIGMVLANVKLLNCAVLLVGSGQKASKFFATVLNLVGSILLPRNCVRQGAPFTTFVVAGSKISP